MLNGCLNMKLGWQFVQHRFLKLPVSCDLSGLWNFREPSLRALLCIVWIYSSPAPSQSPISRAPCSRRSIRILLVCSIVSACICNNADPSPGRQQRFPPSLLLTWMQTAADGVKWRVPICRDRGHQGGLVVVTKHVSRGVKSWASNRGWCTGLISKSKEN